MLIMKEKKPKSISKKPPLNPEDSKIWAMATEDVKNIDRSNHILPPISPRKKRHQPQIHSGQISLETIEPRHPHKSPSSFQMDGSLRKKFEAGLLEIDGKIDLHGLTLAEAHHRFNQFIARKIKEGARFLLVITGKGDSQKSGVIRQNLPKWCEEPPLKSYILALKSAQPKHGGDGASYLYLRKYRD
jgi:DNA-nicking Smr family endonuclease